MPQGDTHTHTRRATQRKSKTNSEPEPSLHAKPSPLDHPARSAHPHVLLNTCPKMHFPALSTLFVALQAAWVYALPPKVQSHEDMELASFTPTEPISGWPTPDSASTSITGVVTDDSISWTSTTTIWPHIISSSPSPSVSYTTTTATQVITATTITVTDNSITWTPTQSISGWPPISNTQTTPGQQVTETFTITYTSWSEETVVLPLPSVTRSQTPAFTIVTVTASPTPLTSTLTGPFTVITVTASPTPSPLGTTTPRFVTITVSEVTIWPAQTTTYAPQSVTLTFTSSSVNESLNSTTVSYSSTVLTLSPPPTFATGTATVGIVGKKNHV
ncbi:hypothetical protein F4679DRAFT_460185 [Xylaria curta]|nr:hypothetical protein F4679DRAFT_460185 [Xylaria curta]